MGVGRQVVRAVAVGVRVEAPLASWLLAPGAGVAVGQAVGHQALLDVPVGHQALEARTSRDITKLPQLSVSVKNKTSTCTEGRRLIAGDLLQKLTGYFLFRRRR